MQSVNSQIRENNRKTVLLVLFLPLFMLAVVFVAVYFSQPSDLGYKYLCYESKYAGTQTAQNVCNVKDPTGVYSVEAERMQVALPEFLLFGAGILGICFLWTLISYYFGDKMILGFANVKPLKKTDNPEVYRLVENMSITGGIPVPKVYLINDNSLNAFATGRSPKKASIALTTGIVKKLEKSELEAVIAHEIGHIMNRDTRLMLIIVIMIGFCTFLGEILIRVRSKKQATIMYIGIAFLIFGYLFAPIIRLAISRQREYLADATSAVLTRNPDALASALAKISQDSRVEILDSKPLASNICIAPPGGATLGAFDLDTTKTPKASLISSIFSTHPPVAERIKALHGFIGKV